MKDAPAVAVPESVDDLLEHVLGLDLLESLALLHVLEEVAAARVLHHHEEVLRALEDLEEADDVRVPDLLQDEYLLEHLLLRKVVLHIVLVYRLYSHVLPCQLVDTQGHFAEGSFAN